MIYKKFVNQIGHVRKSPHETHVSAEPAPAGPNPRFSEPHEHQGRPSGPETPPRQGAQTSDGVAAPAAHTPPRPPRARFRKADRLRRRREFLAAQATGKRLHTPHFGVILAPPGGAPRPRLGLVVSKRVGTAVRRNRVKRLLREFFRRHFAELPPQDIIIMAKKGAETLSYDDVQRELARILLAPRAQGA